MKKSAVRLEINFSHFCTGIYFFKSARFLLHLHLPFCDEAADPAAFLGGQAAPAILQDPVSQAKLLRNLKFQLFLRGHMFRIKGLLLFFLRHIGHTPFLWKCARFAALYSYIVKSILHPGSAA